MATIEEERDATEFAKRHKTSGLQTLGNGVWQSDPLEFFEVSSVLNAWFKIASENPPIHVEHWQIIGPLDIGTYSIVVQLMLPESWAKILHERDISRIMDGGGRG